MDYELEITIEEEITKPKTSEELETMLELDTNDIFVNRKHVKFAVDGNLQGRNAGLDPYYKYYPECTSALNHVDNDQKVYRIYFLRAVFTNHNSRNGGYTPDRMDGDDIDLLLAALKKEIHSKFMPGKPMVYVWEELKYMACQVHGTTLEYHTIPVQEKGESNEEYNKRKTEDYNRVLSEINKYKNIKYDGKR